MNKADFIQWKHLPITELVFQIIKHRISGLEMELGATAGRDPRADAVKVGAIRAYQDILEIDFEDENP